jgi:hypothetical protein
MTVQVSDAHAHVQRLITLIKIATLLEEYSTKERIFQFTMGNICRIKRFTTGSRNSLKDVLKSHMMPLSGGLLRL